MIHRTEGNAFAGHPAQLLFAVAIAEILVNRTVVTSETAGVTRTEWSAARAGLEHQQAVFGLDEVDGRIEIAIHEAHCFQRLGVSRG